MTVQQLRASRAAILALLALDGEADTQAAAELARVEAEIAAMILVERIVG